MSSARPIRLRHAALPLLAMLEARGLDLAIGIAEGYDPAAAVARWRVEIANRYGTPKTWVGTDVVTVDGQTLTLSAAPDAISAEDEELTLADVIGHRGQCRLALIALPEEPEEGEARPLWQCQGPVDFVAAGSDLEGNAHIGKPIPLDLGTGTTIRLAILGTSEQATATVDNATVLAALGEDLPASKEALGIDVIEATVETLETGLESKADAAAVNTALESKADAATLSAHLSDASDAHDASAIGFGPATSANWNGGADPGHVDDALDQLAARAKTLETPAQLKALIETALASGGVITITASGANNSVVVQPNGFGAFQVKGSGAGMASFNLMEFVDANGSRIGMIYNEPNSGKMVFMNSRSGALSFGNSGADRFVVYTSGGVFIGNTAVDPGANSLQVQGGITSGGGMFARGSTTNGFEIFHNATRIGYFSNIFGQARILVGGDVWLAPQGGDAADLRIGRFGANGVQITAADGVSRRDLRIRGVDLEGALKLGAVTVNTLPTASSNAGARYEVSDANSPTVGSAVSSGGSATVTVRSNGSAWIVLQIH